MTTSTLDRSVPPGPGPLRPFEFPPIERFSLRNGIPVLSASTGELPVVTFTLITSAGALREGNVHAGLATLTGSLLESGTRSSTAHQIAERLESIGVRVGVGTSWESTHLQVSALTDRLPEAIELLSELVREPIFPESEFERLRQRQLAGIVQRRADPRGLANECASRFIFAEGSPFARPITGDERTIAALRHDDIVRFHRESYTPHPSSLIVAGNIGADSVLELGERLFGGWDGPELLSLEEEVHPRSEAMQIVLVPRPGAVQSEIRIGQVGVARSTPDYFPILVMNTILGGAFSSRLNLNLRERHGFTYGVSSAFLMRRWPGPFLVSTAVQTEVTGPAVREIMNELEAIRGESVQPTELDDARQYVAGTFPLALQTTEGVAARLADLALYDLPDSFLHDFADRILAVTAEEVRSAALTHLHPERMMVLVVGDPDAVRAQLDELKLPAAEVITFEPEAV